MFVVLTRKEMPSSLDFGQVIGNATGVLKRTPKSIRVIRVFPEVVGIEQDVSAQGLLDTDVVLVSVASPQRRSAFLGERGNQCRAFRRRRDQKVFVVRRLHRPRISRAQGSCSVRGNEVGNAKRGSTSVSSRRRRHRSVDAQSGFSSRAAQRNDVLNVGRVLVDISSRRKLERRSATRQVQRQQDRIEIRIRHEAEGRTLGIRRTAGRLLRIAGAIQTNRIEGAKSVMPK